MPDIKISIITICYNDCEGLRRTMDSVAQQTAVRGADYEYIVIIRTDEISHLSQESILT